MKKSSLSCIVTISIAFLTSLNPLYAADRKAVNKEKYCLFLHTEFPVDVYAREGEYYLVFRGNATSETAAEKLRRDVLQGFPPGTTGIKVETRPYGISQKVEVAYTDGNYIRTLPQRNDRYWSVWIRSRVICPENPKTPFATGVVALR